jgi:hypothetical protein
MAIIWMRCRIVFFRSTDDPRRRSNRHSVGPQYTTETGVNVMLIIFGDFPTKIWLDENL